MKGGNVPGSNPFSFLTTLVLGVCFAAGSARSEIAQPAPDGLKDMRMLAGTLLKKGAGKDTALVLEYQVNRHSNTCTNHQPEIGLRLYGDGRLALLVTRSWAETDDNGPASTRGVIGRAGWDSLFSAIAKMKWLPVAADPFLPMPMPGMSESNYTVRIHSAGKQAEFSLSGSVPDMQDLIRNGLHAASALVESAESDTLWSLRLAGTAPKVKNGILTVKAQWRLKGSQPLRIRMPVKDAPPACGSMELSWIHPAKEVDGETPLPPEIQRVKLAKAPTGAGAWKTLKPGEPVEMESSFALSKSPGGARRGSLIHLGFPISLAGATDTLAVVTLFSGDFNF